VTPSDATGTAYLQIARRRWPVLAVALVLGLIAAILTGGLTDATYTSESRVAVRAIVADPFQPNLRPTDSIDMETEKELAGSTAVVELAAETLDEADPNLPALQAGLEVSTVGEAQVLRISYTASSPEEAQRWAAAITDSYLTSRQARADALIESLVASIDEQIEELEASVEPGDDPDQSTSDRIRDLGTKRSSFLALPTAPGDVIQPAELPGEESSTPTWVGQLGVLALAMLIGCGVAVAIDRADVRTSSTADIAEVAGPLLGDMALNDDREPALLARRSKAGGSAPADAARLALLRLNRMSTRPVEVLVVTCPRSGPPLVEVSTHIATDLAMAGRPVLLVGAGLVTEDGHLTLEDLESGHATLDEVLVRAGSDGNDLWLLDVGPRGWAPGSAAADGRYIGDHRRDLRARFAATVFIVPPILERAASSLELAVEADAVVMVASLHGNAGDLADAVEVLDGVGAKFAGTIVAR
jgi:capsular polysaccharide biosynthesis protein